VVELSARRYLIVRIAVADTHAAVWYLSADPRLSEWARRYLDAAAARGDQIVVSVMTMLEIVFLVEKGRLPQSAWTSLEDALDERNAVFVDVPVTREIAQAMRSIDRQLVPELPDRVIAATALNLGVPVITRDAQIQASGISTIW
jgi:PIN domain nuclease of toxin-antitoxin system